MINILARILRILTMSIVFRSWNKRHRSSRNSLLRRIFLEILYFNGLQYVFHIPMPFVMNLWQIHSRSTHHKKILHFTNNSGIQKMQLNKFIAWKWCDKNVSSMFCGYERQRTKICSCCVEKCFLCHLSHSKINSMRLRTNLTRCLEKRDKQINTIIECV